MRIIVSCDFTDAESLSTLVEGCKVHSDVEAYHLMNSDRTVFEDMWELLFPTMGSVECFVALLTTIDFKFPDLIRILCIEPEKGSAILSLSQFHKLVFHGA